MRREGEATIGAEHRLQRRRPRRRQSRGRCRARGERGGGGARRRCSSTRMLHASSLCTTTTASPLIELPPPVRGHQLGCGQTSAAKEVRWGAWRRRRRNPPSRSEGKALVEDADRAIGPCKGVLTSLTASGLTQLTVPASAAPCGGLARLTEQAHGRATTYLEESAAAVGPCWRESCSNVRPCANARSSPPESEGSCRVRQS